MIDHSIRRASIEDLPGLRIIRSQAIEACYSGVFDRNQFADLVVGRDGRLKASLNDELVTVLVAETEQTPVGYTVVDEATGEISGIFTSPDVQGSGIGTRLLETAQRVLVDAGHDTIEAAVPEAVLPFFTQHGFQSQGATTWRDLPAIAMVSPLDP